MPPIQHDNNDIVVYKSGDERAMQRDGQSVVKTVDQRKVQTHSTAVIYYHYYCYYQPNMYSNAFDMNPVLF